MATMVATVSTTFRVVNMDDDVKMNKHQLKPMVSGKAKEAIGGLGVTAEMYNVACNVQLRNLGKP